MKDHLGPHDVVTGDPKHGTQINISSVFGKTGVSAFDFQSKSGNHLPWFMVKQIVGDSIWDDYLKITIEREPCDRLVSLFCFLNPLLTTLNCKKNKQIKYTKEERQLMSESTPLKLFPERMREYFYDWLEIQLEADVLPLTDSVTYSADAIPLETQVYREAAKRLGIDPWFYDTPSRITQSMGQQNLCDFPPLGTDRVLVPDMHHRNTRHVNFGRYLPFEGQCRFLNYGYYRDQHTTHVDHVISYDNVAENIGLVFEQHGIKINCDKQLYDVKSKNIHFRKNHKLPEKNWWYETSRGKHIQNMLTKRFIQ